MIAIETLRKIFEEIGEVSVDGEIQADWRGPENLHCDPLDTENPENLCLDTYEELVGDNSEAKWAFTLGELLAGTISEDGTALLVSQEDVPHMIEIKFLRSPEVMNLKELA